jgi:DNA polymerase III subunit alpha
MNGLEKAGMLKMDFLGLTTLTIITDAVANVRARGREIPDLDDIPLDDKETYHMLRLGKTAGVFQFESPLATELVRSLRCDRFNDLVASNALMRPGPLDAGMHKVYIRRKRGDEPITYALPELEEFLNDTYGVITYQEQVMRISQKLAGISLAEADVLRKAVGKKDAELIRKELGKFIEKAVALGHDRKIINEIAAQIETFGRYGFNKCLVSSTEVLDASSGRLVKIGDLYNNREQFGAVLTCDVRDLKLYQGRVLDVVDNGVQPVFRLRTRSGREIDATANHPLLTFDGWRELGQLTIGQHIAVPRKLEVAGSDVWPDHEVVALGHLLAEGNLCHPHGLYFYNQNADAIADFIAAAEQFPNVKCTTSRHKGTDYVYTGRRLRREPNGIFEWARKHGMLGKNARDKEIPADAFALKDPQLALLIARMWEGDGHVNLKGRSAFYATASKRLAHQVSHVLLRLGIVPRLREVEFPYKDGRIGYQVFVTGNENLRTFADKVAVHMLAGSKQDRAHAVVLDDVGTASSKDIVPFAVYATVASERQRTGGTWPEVASATAMSTDAFPPRTAAVANGGGYTRATVAKLASYFDSEELYRVSESDVLWDPVVSIEPLGEMRTYDLEVEGTHNFVANDIIVHNSHAVAYSIISYQTAWLKTHFPAEFMAALLSSQIGDTDSVVKYINEAREIELEVLPPDVNESNYKFTVIADKKIRFGLGAIRNVGKSAIESILEARKAGPFTSLFDLCNRVDLRMCNKRVLEAMIHAGALDSLGGHRSQLVAALDTAIREASLAQEDVASGQVSMFGDALGATSKPAHQTTLPNVAPWPESERLANEKAILGFYTSGHPLEPFRAECELFSTHNVSDLGTWTSEPMSLCCVITMIKRQTSKKSGAEFARLTIEDFSGSAEVLVFPEAWSVIHDQVKADVPVVMKGGYSRRDEGADNPTFIVESVTKLAEKRTNGQVAVAIDLAPGMPLDPAVMRDVQEVVHAHPGTAPLELRWSDGNGAAARWRSRSLKLSADGVALKELRSLLGDECVSVILGT